MDKAEFCALVEKYQRKMYGIAYQVLNHEADAWDAVSSGLLHAYEKKDELRDKEKFHSWIFQIIKNEAINILREKKKEEELWEKLAQPLPEEDVQKKELSAAVHDLPEDCRSEIILCYYSGLSLKEISEVKNIPVGTVKSRLHRGKKLLRQKLKERGVVLDNGKEDIQEKLP